MRFKSSVSQVGLRPAVVMFAVFCAAAQAADWPQWRGPDRNGISAEKGWLDQWPAAGPTIAWRAQVGLGASSFVVAGGRVYTMGAVCASHAPLSQGRGVSWWSPQTYADRRPMLMARSRAGAGFVSLVRRF
mgnify:CR=1 FL=1